MFSDYYDQFFGRHPSRSQRVVETDTWARMETRAFWGALGGMVLGIYMAVRDARRPGKNRKDDNDIDGT